MDIAKVVQWVVHLDAVMVVLVLDLDVQQEVEPAEYVVVLVLSQAVDVLLQEDLLLVVEDGPDELIRNNLGLEPMK